MHDKGPKSISGRRFLKNFEKKKINGHNTISFQNSIVKVVQLNVYVEFLTILESGEKSNKAMIISMAQEILLCHLEYRHIRKI